MTAPQPSPETPEQLLEYLVHVHPGKWMPADQLEHIRARDASLTAPLRAEVERLTRRIAELECGDMVGVPGGSVPARIAYAVEAERADQAEAYAERLRVALQPFAEFGAVVGGNARDHVCGMYVAVGKRRDLHVSDFRAAARALAEGKP